MLVTKLFSGRIDQLKSLSSTVVLDDVQESITWKLGIDLLKLKGTFQFKYKQFWFDPHNLLLRFLI